MDLFLTTCIFSIVVITIVLIELTFRKYDDEL